MSSSAVRKLYPLAYTASLETPRRVNGHGLPVIRLAILTLQGFLRDRLTIKGTNRSLIIPVSAEDSMV